MPLPATTNKHLYLSPLCTHTHTPLQPAELAELKGTAAADKLDGRVLHPADAPTRVGELFDALVVPLVESDATLAAMLLGDNGGGDGDGGGAKAAAAEKKKGKQKKKGGGDGSEDGGGGGALSEADRQRLRAAYEWATCAVAAYSFVLGDDSFQGMVPVWDVSSPRPPPPRLPKSCACLL